MASTHQVVPVGAVAVFGQTHSQTRAADRKMKRNSLKRTDRHRLDKDLIEENVKPKGMVNIVSSALKFW